MALLLEGFWGPYYPRIHTTSKQPRDAGLLEAALCGTVFLMWSQDHLYQNHLNAG